ncbi:AAA family ATPase [Zopfia rhizophila CBS 207.26]|uniref:AAA family ATPase n=1 Tax=Zopfia rhizophila CBS 207.26 TaxID=1314779 RepID=A0A6A6E9K1_9PEZI|nr:AAA family ATPase [Zopfia rhizophila CBS 207.26]
MKPQKPELTDDDFFICRNTTIAFALDQKVWVHNVRISLLRDIEWDSDPFKLLQFSEDAKLLVYRLVKGFNNRNEDVYDDIIRGKGKGLIFLLHGPPGLGKTLTAESVAESARRPLYRVTTGELSTDVEKLEKQLGDIFRLGARWKAVVLLDEADVLMSQRTVDDLRRNSIVAVFLRLLEYYRGMLFLTTNRHKDFDEAFYSRIHVTIQFGSLIPEWRANIWREHIQRASGRNRQPGLWSEDMFEVLGEIDTNGRDIKNYTRTAYAFARAEDEDLTLHHTLVVLRNNLPDEKFKAHKVTFGKLDILEKELRKRIEKWENQKATAATIASAKVGE